MLLCSLLWILTPRHCKGEEGSAAHQRSRAHEIEVKILNAILKKNVPRKFDFNHADFSLLSGISIVINQLKVSENPAFKNHPLKDYDRFYTDETMRVSIKALPLFVAKVSMKEMHMEKPFFHVLRNEKKELSVDDLFKGNKGPVLGWLNVDQWTISNGTLRFIDAAAPRRAFVALFSNLNATISGLSVHEIFKVNISLKGPGSPKPNCFFDGTAGPINDAANLSQVPVSMNFRLKDAKIANYSAYFAPGLPVPISGLVSIGYQVNGDFWSGLHMKGSSVVHDLTLSSDDGREKKSIPFTLGMSLNQSMIFSMKEEKLTIENAEIQLNRSRFIIDGTISRISENPWMDIRLAATGIDLDDIKQIYPFHGEYMPDSFIYSGRSGMSLHMKGDQKKVILSGRIDFSDTLLEVTGFFRKNPSDKLLLQVDASTFPQTKRFEGTGSVQSGAIEIFTPKGYQRFRETLCRHFHLETGPCSSHNSFSETPVVAESMEGHVAFSDDQIILENVTLKNCRQGAKEGIDAVVSGWVDLIKKRIYLAGEAVLSLKESASLLSARPADKSIIRDEMGRIHLPITISGGIEKPVIQLDHTIFEVPE